jgi:hypothetical protein
MTPRLPLANPGLSALITDGHRGRLAHGPLPAEADSAVVRPAAVEQIAQLGDILARYPDDRIRIEGHTDASPRWIDVGGSSRPRRTSATTRTPRRTRSVRHSRGWSFEEGRVGLAADAGPTVPRRAAAVGRERCPEAARVGSAKLQPVGPARAASRAVGKRYTRCWVLGQRRVPRASGVSMLT